MYKYATKGNFLVNMPYSFVLKHRYKRWKRKSVEWQKNASS